MNFSEAFLLMKQGKWVRVQRGRMYTVQDGTIVMRRINPDAYTEDEWWKKDVCSWEDAPPFKVRDLMSNCWEEAE